MDSIFKIILGLFLLFVAAIFIWLYALVGKAADKRGRSAGGWIIFALIFSPLAAWIVLLCLGDTDAKRHQKIIEEEELRQRVARKYNGNQPLPVIKQSQQTTANPLGKTINDLYKK